MRYADAGYPESFEEILRTNAFATFGCSRKARCEPAAAGYARKLAKAAPAAFSPGLRSGCAERVRSAGIDRRSSRRAIGRVDDRVGRYRLALPASSRRTADGGSTVQSGGPREHRHATMDQRIDLDVPARTFIGARSAAASSSNCRRPGARPVGSASVQARRSSARPDGTSQAADRLVCVGDRGQSFGRAKRQAGHMGQPGFDHRDPDQPAHDPILQHGVGGFLDQKLQRWMALLDLNDRVSDAIEQESVLIDRRQDADRDAPARGGAAVASRFESWRERVSMSDANSVKRSPRSVGTTPSPRRSNKAPPSVASSLCSCSLTAGWLILTAWAAAETRLRRCTILK